MACTVTQKRHKCSFFSSSNRKVRERYRVSFRVLIKALLWRCGHCDVKKYKLWRSRSFRSYKALCHKACGVPAAQPWPVSILLVLNIPFAWAHTIIRVHFGIMLVRSSTDARVAAVHGKRIVQFKVWDWSAHSRIDLILAPFEGAYFCQYRQLQNIILYQISKFGKKNHSNMHTRTQPSIQTSRSRTSSWVLSSSSYCITRQQILISIDQTTKYIYHPSYAKDATNNGNVLIRASKKVKQNITSICPFTFKKR